MGRCKRDRARVLSGVALVALVCATEVAQAQSTPSTALDPAPAGERTFLTEAAQVRGDGHLRVRLLGDYASEPLVLLNDAQQYDRVIVEQLWLHALASLSVSHRFLVALDVPSMLSQSGDPPPSRGGTAPRPAGAPLLGDVRLGGRLKLLGDAGEGMHFGVAAAVWLPTGSEGGYTSDDALRFRGALVADGVHDRFFWALDGGLKTRPGARLPGILPTRVGTALTASAAAGVLFDSSGTLQVGPELSTSLGVGESATLLDPRASLLQLLLGARWQVLGGPFEAGAAFGPTLGQAPGAADLRALAYLGFSPEQAPPPPDADDDGVPDRSDACRELPGVPSQDPLLHGCPEAPKDFDGDEIPDEFDACPKEPGEPTSIRATHGCPRIPDTDGDGIDDRKDACPKQPGPKSADPKKNGCPPPPPPPPPIATLEHEQIVISQQVQFEFRTAVLRAESDPILEEVAKVLSEHPEVELVEVQGHTDDVGGAEVNRTLSQARAESVVQWLVNHGIDRARLAPRGYGPDRPIAENTTDEGRAKNRRVEFRVLKGPGTPAEAPP